MPGAHRLVASTPLSDADGVEINLTVDALDGIDVYVNQRSTGSAAVTDKQHTLVVPVPATGPAVVRLAGFDGAALVAARILDLGEGDR